MVPRMGVRTEYAYRHYWLTNGSGSEVVVILFTGVPAELGRGLGNDKDEEFRSGLVTPASCYIFQQESFR